ncbi:MAG: S8 family serine peptidase, partial [Planctomycetota bacterium]
MNETMNRRTILRGGFCIAILIGFQTLAQAGPAQAPGKNAARVVVKFRPGIAAQNRTALIKTKGHRSERSIHQLQMHVIPVPPGRTAQDVIARYSNHPLVEFAEPEVFGEPQLAPNDPWFTYWQYELQQMGADDAWDITTGSPEVPIAVLDTGLDVDHYEFVDRI